jgi:general secretion pathway protein B
MSYILDALRKSDQQRQRGMAPTLLTAQAATVATGKPSLLAYASLGVVLLAVGIAIGWLRPWQEHSAAPKPAATASQSEPDSARSLSVAPSGPPSQPSVPAKTGDATAMQSRESQAATTSVQAAKTLSQQQETKRVAVKPQAAPQQKAAISSDRGEPIQVPAAGADSPPAVQAQEPPWMTDLPVDVQRDLPPMQIMAHAYSTRSAERLVGINNKLLHEGDEVAPGLKLEQITPEGMVLNFKGHVFRRGVH